MNFEQALIIFIIAVTMALFISGKWRHDMVALAALLMCVAAGAVSPEHAFSGFGHPAVITVACILILSAGLQQTGAVDILSRRIIPGKAGTTASIAAMSALGAFLSAFMNNVGAMALLIPVAVQMSARLKLPPGKILMPLAFGTILGGTITLIGTPPNLIVSGFRAEAGEGAFGMFSFAPVGFSIAFCGIAFISLAGWRIVPARKEGGTGKFDIGKYLTELRVLGGGKLDGKTFSGAAKLFEENDAQLLAMLRNEIRIQAPSPRQLIRGDDVLIVEAEPDSIPALIGNLGLKLEEDVKEEDDNDSRTKRKKNNNEETGKTENIALSEFIVMQYSRLTGRSASDINMRALHGINLLAFSRRGRRSIKRLSAVKFLPGDVLLLQGDEGALAAFAEEFKLAPLADRQLSVPDRRRALKASGILAAAIAVTALGGVHVAISFSAAVFAFLLLGIVPLRSVYDRIDWPVIILLGAMLPVAGAVGESGAADVIANFFITIAGGDNPVFILIVILALTMVMTDFMNNAATAALMCPVALSAAAGLEVNPDAFLMAVAIGASCAFLTPIGHQNNTLILGPGGFRFGDYWRLGILVEIIILAAGIPLLLIIWPL